MAQGEWRDVVLITIRETPSKKADKPDEGYGLWVVARVKPDNTLFNVTVRSGRYYPNKVDGSKTLPKDGIGFYDFMEFKKPSKTQTHPVKACACGAVRTPTVWEDILALLDPKNPPVLPDPNIAQAATPPPEPDIPQMPW
jgi:hypothetical protein